MSKKLYNIEFAINTKSEIAAIKLLSNIFGEEIANKVTLRNLSRRSGLFFINLIFAEEELSDEKYKLLSKSKDIIIVKDELSFKRANELLRLCLPIEIQLKRLLIYVYTEIVVALTNKDTKKNRIEICSMISSMMLGELLTTLQIDLTAKSREQLLTNNGLELFSLLSEAENYDELKQKLLQYTKPHLVWDEINSVLQEPISYEKISKQLGGLRALRNKAAHPPQPILKYDLRQGKKCAKHVEKYILKIRNDYNDSLQKSIIGLAKTMQQLIKTISPSSTMADIGKEIQFTIAKNLAPSINAFQNQIANIDSVNWLNEYSKMIKNGMIPNLSNDNFKAEVEKMQSELKDDVNSLNQN